MNVIVVSGIVLTVLLLSILLGKRLKLYADQFLILYLLFSLFNYAWVGLEANGYFQQGDWLLLGKVAYLLNAPLFFFYVYALTQQERRLRWSSYLVMLLPAMGYVINFFYYHWWGFEGKEVDIINGLLYINKKLSVSWTIFVALFLMSDLLYLIPYHFLLKQYRAKIFDSASYIDRIHLNWLTLLFYLWLVSALVLAPMAMLSMGTSWIGIELLQQVLLLFNVVSTFIIGYYGFKQTTVFSDVTWQALIPVEKERIVYKEEITGNETPVAYERSGLSKEQAQLYHLQLLELMKTKKPYLDGELNASQLAGMMGISTNHLSQVLNQEQRQNFFDFINSYRVEEVKERMKSDRYKHMTLLAIALESGFNSKTSFNTLFKKFTGQTPSQYHQSL